MWTFLAKLVTWLLGFLIKEAAKPTPPPTQEDAKPMPKLRDKLKSKIARAGKPVLLLVVLSMALMSGCTRTQVRTVYIHPTTPVRLAEDVDGVWVWVPVQDGPPRKVRVDLDEGLFVVYMSPEELADTEWADVSKPAKGD